MAVTLPEVVEELLSEMAAAVRDSAKSTARGLLFLPLVVLSLKPVLVRSLQKFG